MDAKTQKIITGVKMYDTVQEGIQEALAQQDEIDNIQTTKNRAVNYFNGRKAIEAGKKEIERKIEKEYKRKIYDQQDRNFDEQRVQDEGRNCKTIECLEAEELRKIAAETIQQKELTEEEIQQYIINYLDAVIQLPEFWTGKMEKPDGRPQKEEIELMERRSCQGIIGHLIRNKTTGKRYFVPDLQDLNQNVTDKLSATVKINFMVYLISMNIASSSTVN